MPQEYAIYDNLTIEENVVHFARLTQVPESQIKTRFIEMKELFELPDNNKLICNLSGGQRRRVSLACSLIHHPRLAILDEPTAGVDPILCQKIWDYLVWISKWHKTTVIITTHYIEEARKAQRIGFMRKGRLMIEDDPLKLMSEYGSKTLEDAFLQLCQLDSKRNTMRTAKDIITFKTMRSKSIVRITELHQFEKPCLKKPSNFKINCKIFMAILKTSIKITLRDPLSVLLQYIIPMLLMFLAYFGLGSTPFDIKVGFINQDQMNFPVNLDLGDNYLKSMNDRVIDKIKYGNISQAVNDARKGKIWGYFVIPEMFTLNSMNRFESNVSDEIIKGSKIIVQGDLSHKIVAMTIVRSMQNYHLSWAKNQLESHNISVNLIDPYISLSRPIYGNITLDDFSGYRKYLMPGFMLNCVLAISMAISSVAITSLKQSQTLERTRVCGVSTGQLLLTHGISRLIMNFILIVIIILMSDYFFEPNYPEMVYSTVFLLYLSVILGTVMGIIFATVLPDISAALNVISGVYIILLFTTGSLWPIQSIPTKFQSFCKYLPITGSAEAYRSVLFRGWSFDHPFIYPKLAYDILFTLICAGMSYYFFKKLK